MNGMFNRINNCDTSAGEEILYWKLRRNDMEDEEREIFEKRVSAFGRDEKLREETENILCNIGKESASYYIPSYMDGIGGVPSEIWMALPGAFRSCLYSP